MGGVLLAVAFSVSLESIVLRLGLCSGSNYTGKVNRGLPSNDPLLLGKPFWKKIEIARVGVSVIINNQGLRRFWRSVTYLLLPDNELKM